MSGSRIHDRTDDQFMDLALQAALRGVGRSAPNPPVGAVVVRDGEVVSTGHHARAGAPHAEAAALSLAGERARGATLYVTLEPCCHAGRTPPCTDAIIEAGLAEVVFALLDPSPHCAGKGEAALLEAGIRIRKGPGRRRAERLAAPFLKRVRTGLPFVLAKWAMTLDGKTASRTGDSRWISSTASRALAHRIRSRVGAVLVGIGTVLADNPSLDVRLPRRGQPLRVVADPECSTPPGSRLAETARASSVVVAHAPVVKEARLEALRAKGVMTLPVPPSPGGLDLEALLRALASGSPDLPAVDAVLLEGGGELTASAFEAGLVDRVSVFVAPKILGGRGARTPVAGKGPEKVAEALRIDSIRVRRIGPDLLIEGDAGKTVDDA